MAKRIRFDDNGDPILPAAPHHEKHAPEQQGNVLAVKHRAVEQGSLQSGKRRLPVAAETEPEPRKRARSSASSAPSDAGGEEVKADGAKSKGNIRTALATVERVHWPFVTDFNDHFETSRLALEHITPLLHHLSALLRKKPSDLIIYDPFYCKGSIVETYRSMGFSTVIHRNRDFYADVRQHAIPPYDVLVTNPPYSGTHKERILEFVVNSKKPWLLLMPNYVATKQYFLQGSALKEPARDQSAHAEAPVPFFLVPRQRYEFAHPTGLGHDHSPFDAIWFISAGTAPIHQALQRQLASIQSGSAGLCLPVDSSAADYFPNAAALRDHRKVPTHKRGNPRQRKKMRQQRGQPAA